MISILLLIINFQLAILPQEAIQFKEDPFENQMVAIQTGSFEMGSPSTEVDRKVDEVQHTVSLNSFRMGKYEVTQAQWQMVMGNNPSRFKDCPNCPVELVSWEEVQLFLQKLNKMTGKAYRLPTEAEWEYACRAGTKTAFNTGDNLKANQANYDGKNPYNGNSKGKNREKTMPVGSFSPNAFGLYDMHGNIWEFCNDWYDKTYYTNSPANNPLGSISGTERVLRGGGWSNYAHNLRSAYRLSILPNSRGANTGFRVAE